MDVQRLLDGNRAWVREHLQRDPEYFKRRAATHAPSCLFIGCSDARVPADLIAEPDVGEVFVHRNIANQVVATDNNSHAVIQYAVEVLRVSSIVVCGARQLRGSESGARSNGAATRRTLDRARTQRSRD